MPGYSVPITLADGKERHLRYDFNALIAIEETLGIPIDSLESVLTGPMRKLSMIRGILWAGLVHEDKALTQEDVGALLDLSNMEKMATAIVAAVGDSLSGDGEPKNG